MKFFREELVGENVYYLSAFKVLESDGLGGLIKTIREQLMSRSASFLVLDGLVTASESAATDRELKKFIHELQTLSGMSNCTIVLLTSIRRSEEVHPEDTMVDGIIELTDELRNLKPIRELHVRKLRGTNQIRGKHTLDIRDEGIVVRPRVETQLRLNPEAVQRISSERVRFGIQGLDDMLRGGLPEMSTTMLLGPSGTGKTILGLKFLAAGSERDEAALHFGFHETPSLLLEKSRRLKLGLETLEKKKLLHFACQPAVEGNIDVLGERLLNTVRAQKIRRLFIDGMHGFQLAADYPARVRDMFSAISDELETLNVTTLFTAEQRFLFSSAIEPPVEGLSAMTENIILLQHVELDAALYRLLAVLKLRGGGYDSTIHELKIGDEGIEVLNTFAKSGMRLSGLIHGRGSEDSGPAGS
jgi:circadian clock protein KaiC